MDWPGKPRCVPQRKGEHGFSHTRASIILLGFADCDFHTWKANTLPQPRDDGSLEVRRTVSIF